MPCNQVARLNPDGSLDTTYDPVAWANVRLIATPEGGMIAGGSFTNLGGTPRRRVARWKPDGLLDASFDPGVGPDHTVAALALQPDGRLLVGGSFTNVAGVPRRLVARLTSSGALDPSFQAGIVTGTVVRHIVRLPDGRLLIQGSFTHLGGSVRRGLARLQADGALDPAFQAGSGPNGSVAELLVLGNGKLALRGGFTAVDGTPRPGLALLHADGALDSGFQPVLSLPVGSFRESADGKLWITGDSGSYVARLNLDGTFDASFHLQLGTLGMVAVAAAVVLPNDQVVLAGWPTPEAREGADTTRVVRVDPDGRLDPTFVAHIDAGSIRDLALQPDGRLLVCGSVVSASGLPRIGITRIYGGTAPVPHLLRHPRSAVVVGGTAHTLVAEATGRPPLTYRWWKDGTLLAGATQPTLVLSPFDLTRSGSYQLTVSNQLGLAASDVAVLALLGKPVFLSQPAAQVTARVGDTVSFSASAYGVAPLTFQWQFDGMPLPGATGTTLVLGNVQFAQAGTYALAASNPAGQGLSEAASLTVVYPPAGTPAPDFDAGPGLQSVTCLGRQTDGRILIGGTFTNIQGHERHRLARLQTNGTLDLSFDPGTGFDGPVECLALQADGKVVVGGSFLQANGLPRQRLARLNANGSVDTAFAPSVGSTYDNNGGVWCLAIQPNAHILFGGRFDRVNGAALHRNVARLNPGGGIDGSFHGPFDTAYVNGLYGPVYSLALATNQTILIGGDFDGTANSLHKGLVRLILNGSSFDNTFANADLDGPVRAIVPLANGKFYVGGEFGSVNNHPNTGRFHRLRAEGGWDPGFNTVAGDPVVSYPGVGGMVHAIAVQPDGRILLGGLFSQYNGTNRPNLARLTPSGHLDPTFDPGSGPNGRVRALLLEPDGDLLVAGDFTVVNGHPASGIARIKGGKPPVITRQPATQVAALGGNAAFSVAASGVPPLRYQWRFRESDLPDATNAVLALSLVGTNHQGPYRVLVYDIAGTAYSAEADLVLEAPPVIEIPPQDLVAMLGGTARFSVQAAGSPPLRYQWFHEQSRLNTFTNPVCQLGNLGTDRAGAFTVVVSNAFGSVTSPPAILTLAPWQPDLSFQHTTEYAQVPYEPVTALEVAPDGSVLAGTLVHAWADPTRTGVLRFLPDGQHDPTFSVRPAPFAWIRALLREPDGRVVVGGSFLSVNGVPRRHLVRVLSDGTVDPGFTSPLVASPGADSGYIPVQCLDRLPDGRLLVGGWFTNAQGRAVQSLVRVLPDGSPDPNFDPGPTTFVDGRPNLVSSVVLQPDGRVLVGCDVFGAGGRLLTGLVRLNSSGSLDPTFGALVNGPVRKIALDAAGRILVSGEFNGVNGVARTRIARLLPSGSLDLTFDPGTGIDSDVLALVAAPDGRIWLGGWFDRYDGLPAPGLVVVGEDGRRDASVPLGDGPNSAVNCAHVHPDGHVVLGGIFNEFNHAWVPYLAHLFVPPAGRGVGVPAILRHPVPTTVLEGNSATLDVVADGAPLLRYQWTHDGLDLPGATNAALVLTNVLAAQAGEYAVLVRNAIGSMLSDAVPFVVTPRPAAPVIVAQPRSQSVQLGDSALFEVAVQSRSTVRYQWHHGLAPMPARTNASLHLAAVDAPDSGPYSVTVANADGSVASDLALLDVVAVSRASRVIRVPGTLGTAGTKVTLPVQLVAQGNEHAVAFTLDFAPDTLAFADLRPGADAPGAMLAANTNRAGTGRVGVLLALPAGHVFAPGTRSLVEVDFLVARGASPQWIGFADQPVRREIADPDANPLAAGYESGLLVTSVSAGFEGDVAPRPNGSNDGTVTLVDWVQMGRFVALLEHPDTDDERQRADCAPKSKRGDGELTAADWAQAGRYASGLDPAVATGGPSSASGRVTPTTAPSPATARPRSLHSGSERELRLDDATIDRGGSGTVRVDLVTLGGENAGAFSLQFDPRALRLDAVEPGLDVANGLFQVNLDGAQWGRIGIGFALPAGLELPGGIRDLARLDFLVLPDATVRSTTVRFADAPLVREVVDAMAEPLPWTSRNGTVTVRAGVAPEPVLAIRRADPDLVLSWPLALKGFVLETTDSLAEPAWHPVADATPGSTGDEASVTVPISAIQRFYRLRR